MKKDIFFILVLIMIAQLANAAEVCVIVDFGSDSGMDPESECVDVDGGADGHEVLLATQFDLLWTEPSEWGQMICKIDGYGTDVEGQTCYYNGKFWNFVLSDNSEWGHSPIGLNGGDECWNRDFSFSDWNKIVHYCAKEGDVIGFAFGDAGAEPNMFEVNVTKIYVDGEKQSDSKTRGGKIVDAFPGSKIEVKIELENFYDSSTDIDITDIVIIGTIEEIDDGEDIEEEIREFDLSADKKTSKDLQFTIPLEVEEKDRLLVIELEAEDSAGIKYERKFKYDLEVEKSSSDLRILSAKLDKESYKCGENAMLSLSVINAGKGDEDVLLRIENEGLDFFIKETFELSDDLTEESSRYDKLINIWIPQNIDNGTYEVVITAEYGEKKTESVDLVVECESIGNTVSKNVSDMETPGSSNEKTIEFNKELKEVDTEKTYGNLPAILIGLLLFLILIVIILGVIFWSVKR